MIQTLRHNKKKAYRLSGWLLLLAVFFAAAAFTGCDPALFFARKNHLADLAADMLRPDLSYLPKILTPLFYTLQMSVCGTILGSVLGLLAAPFGTVSLQFPAVFRRLVRFVIQVLRSFPALVLALLATFLFGLGTFAGTFAITLYTFAIMTKLTYEDADAANIAAYRALRAMGCAPFPAFVHAILSEILPSYLTNALYLLETNVRQSSILGYVGAGGIGLILNEKISWREFQKVGAILLVLFLTVCVIESASHYLSALIRREFLTRSVSVSKRRQHLMLLGTGTFLLFCFCLAAQTPPDFSHTSPGTLKSMVSGLLQADWAFFFSTKKDGLFYLLFETVCISIVGTGIGALLAVPFAFCGTRRFAPAPVCACFRLLVIAIRSIPFLIYGLIFIRVSGPGAFTGVLTLAMCSIGLLTKRFSECLDMLDPGPYRALTAMGVSPLAAIRHAVLPLIAPAFGSAVLYRFDVNIREASVLGLVGAGGIGAPLIFAMNKYDWSKAGAILLGLILLVWIVDVVSGKLAET